MSASFSLSYPSSCGALNASLISLYQHLNHLRQTDRHETTDKQEGQTIHSRVHELLTSVRLSKGCWLLSQSKVYTVNKKVDCTGIELSPSELKVFTETAITYFLTEKAWIEIWISRSREEGALTAFTTPPCTHFHYRSCLFCDYDHLESVPLYPVFASSAFVPRGTVIDFETLSWNASAFGREASEPASSCLQAQVHNVHHSSQQWKHIFGKKRNAGGQ